MRASRAAAADRKERASGSSDRSATKATKATRRSGAPARPSRPADRPARIRKQAGRKPRLNPTLAAVTAASIGVTSAVGGGLYLFNDHLGSADTLVLSDLGRSGVLSSGKHARRETPSQKASPRYSTRTVEPKATATPTGKPATGTVLLDRTAAVERRQAEERKEAAARAARARERLALSDPKAIAERLAAKQGWDSTQVSCLDTLWEHESGWRTDATNPSSGAYGIPQALPGDKMAAYGSDWRTNPETQIEWGINYIASRYSTPCGAWSFWRANGWY